MKRPTRGEVVDLLTLMGGAMRRAGDLHRARAYARAADALSKAEDFEDLLARGRLQDLPGIGPAIDRKVRAFVEKGEKPAWIQEGAPAAKAGNKVRPSLDAEGVRTIPRSWHAAPFDGVPDLHCHTTWSDGTLSLEEVVAFARRLGAPGIGVSDHSGSLRIANGLRPAEVVAQWDAIDRLQEDYPDVRILKGTECDILREGALDHPERLLTGFDYVIGSLHSQLRLPEKAQTARVLAALDQPHLTILGHPTTAVPGRRPPAEVDWPAVFEKAAEKGVAMEVNGNPGRLDLPVKLIRKALDAGCRLSLGSDGHSAREMLALEKARRMAAQAGATEADLVNVDVLARATPREKTRGGKPRLTRSS
jgi:histidinol phosphatase-like PHP family hydrolase